MESSYITSALKPEQLPEFEFPEVAVIGRSNSGKSTLLNGILARRGLVRSGRTPGQTQLINFFMLNNSLIFADLPGFGYSKTNKDNRAHWQELMTHYLQRPTLQSILFLTDIRRKMENEDLELLDWVHRNAETTVIANKSDKISQSQVKKSLDQIKKQLNGAQIEGVDVRALSAMKKSGVAQLREELLKKYIP